MLFIAGLMNAVLTSHASHSFLPPRAPGDILYQLKDGVSPKQKEALNQILKVHHLQMKHLFQLKQPVYLSGLPAGEVLPAESEQKEEEIARGLLATGAVTFAHPDYLVYPAEVFPTDEYNDPNILSQWFHNNIKSRSAWQITAGKAEVAVAVCDTGVDPNHPDLADRILRPGANLADGTADSGPIAYHGTAVSGVIVSVANNGVGGVGIANQSRVLPLRVSNEANGSALVSTLVACVQYAADHGAKVINVSFSGANNPVFDAAGEYAKSKGALFFMAAGNEGMDTSNSPNFTSFIRVGSTQRADQRSSFSNYGTSVSFFAPGEGIFTTFTGDSFRLVSGTSFSAPIAAAVAALIYSINPAWSADEVQQILFDSADRIGSPNIFGRGRLNAAAAVHQAKSKMISAAAAFR